jgi:hypothetical protein
MAQQWVNFDLPATTPKNTCELMLIDTGGAVRRDGIWLRHDFILAIIIMAVLFIMAVLTYFVNAYISELEWILVSVTVSVWLGIWCI